MIESAPLFVYKKERVVFFSVFLVLIVLSFGYEYYKFDVLKRSSLHVSKSRVLNHYIKISKNGKKYDVFKLKSRKGVIYYTVSWKRVRAKIGDTLRVGFFTKNIDFLDYLRGFFAPSKFIEPISKSKEEKLYSFITSQHKTYEAKEIFKALFFATPISKDIREKIQILGISHLMAISGFHLGVLGGILFFLLSPVYRFFQDRFSPYRNRKLDLSLIVFTILYLYIYFLDFTPSLLRAFVMGIFGFFFYSRNIKILSFENLLISIMFIILLFPRLLFSISFWFSVCGVFYIFLFLYHFGKLNKIAIFIFLNFWVYFMMIPIIHYIFPTFTLLQFFSPILSMAFVVFYPVSLFLHLINQGGLLDSLVSWLLGLDSRVYEVKTPLWFLITYLALSLSSIRSRVLAFITFLFSFGVFII